jgi:hypothetical protein
MGLEYITLSFTCSVQIIKLRNWWKLAVPILIHGRFEMLTPVGLEVQIFVTPKDAKNVPAELRGRVREEATSKGCCRWLSNDGDNL